MCLAVFPTNLLAVAAIAKGFLLNLLIDVSFHHYLTPHLLETSTHLPALLPSAPLYITSPDMSTNPCYIYNSPSPLRPLLRTRNYGFASSATNELPLTAINFHRGASTPNTPDSVLHEPHDYLLHTNLLRVSPLATNERPLSCSCLPRLVSPPSLVVEYRQVIPSILVDVASNAFSGTWLPTVDYGAHNIRGSPRRLTKIYKIEKMRRNSWSAEYLMLTHHDVAERLQRVASAARPVICLTQSHDRLFDELIYMRTTAWPPSVSSQFTHYDAQCLNNPMPDALPRTAPIVLSATTTTANVALGPFAHSQLSLKTTTTTTDISTASSQNPTITLTITTPPTIITTTDPTTTSQPSSSAAADDAAGIGAATSSVPGSAHRSSAVSGVPHAQPSLSASQSPGATSTASSSSVRRQRHSIAGQMSYFKMLGFGGFSKKMATSTNSLFSTAVISGSSSAPNLRDMIPSTASPSGECKIVCTIYSL